MKNEKNHNSASLIRLSNRVILSLLLLPLFIIDITPAIADDTAAALQAAPAIEASSEQPPEQAPAPENDFSTAIDLLKEKSFKTKAKAVEQLQTSNDPRTLRVLKYLLGGDIYYRKQDKLIVYMDKDAGNYTATDVLSGKTLGDVEKSDYKKVIMNNRMRGQLRGAIAQLSLGNADPAVRLVAVREMLEDASAETAELIRERIGTESDSDVRQAMSTLIALSEINSDDKNIRLQAIKLLSGNLEVEAFNRLNQLLQKDDDGSYLETDREIIKAATDSVNHIKDKRGFYDFLETIFFGLSLGSVLLLAAIGLAITFGVMGVINMAHGELIMLGAYTTYVVQLLMPNSIEYSLFVAVPAAFIVSGLFGIAIERGVIRFLYGRPLETLLATFGVSLILQQMVRSIFGTLNLAVETPQWMSGALEINSAFTLTYNRFYIVIFSLMVFFALMAVLKKTSLGLQVRAVSQNRRMAKAMGVKTEWVDALTFGLGSGVAGVAGVALSQLTNVGSNLGQAYIIDSFMVVVFGGVGNLWGTLVAAMSLGVVNKFIEPWSGAVMAKILILIFIILFIQKKPRGLFPQKGRAAEN